MQRVLVASLLALSIGWTCAQAELFAIVRDGTLSEVVGALSGRGDLTRLVDEYEQDLLMYAASGNTDPDVVRHLVSLGFTVNRVTSARWTALMYAVRFNPEPLVAQALIELGATVGTANLAGQRAIELAASNPNPDYASHPVMRSLIPVVPLLTPAAPAAPSPPPQQQTQRTCCRVCSAGKACGNSCISRSKTCHQGVGCACQGVTPDNPLLVPEIRAVGLLDAGELAAAGCDFTNIAVGGRFGATVFADRA